MEYWNGRKKKERSGGEREVAAFVREEEEEKQPLSATRGLGEPLSARGEQPLSGNERRNEGRGEATFIQQQARF